MKKIMCFLFLTFFFSINVKAIEVNNFQELKDAINNNESEIVIKEDFAFNELLTINYDVTIDGGNHTLTRDSSYLKGLFSITSGYTLNISNLVIDGGASGWKMDYDNRYYTQANNKGYVRVPTITVESDLIASATLIANSGSIELDNVTVQNIRCTVGGCAIRGNGNNTLKNSTFMHIGSSTSGGAIYINGGKTIIDKSTFKDNAAGCGVTTAISGGSIYITGATLLDISNNSLFEDNFAQGNAGALYIIKTNLNIKDTIFRHNMVGNDGSAIQANSTTGTYSYNITDTIFEKNVGFAITGQSMGVIWHEQWISTEDAPLTYKNVIFRENTGTTGGGIADNAKSNTYIYMENIESYNNNVNAGGLLYAQAVNYYLKNIDVHDNTPDLDTFSNGNGAAVYSTSLAKTTIDGGKIYNNKSRGSGTALYLIAGELEVNNLEIYDNETIANRGAGIFVRGYYDEYQPVLTLNNTIVRNNHAVTAGGGIAVSDNANIFSSITIDDQSKIYDNSSETAGDDFSYQRADDSVNDTDQKITLDNISIAGITGIDGWYNDSEDNRYIDTNNPEVFNDYVGFNGTSLYLKAGGLTDLDYDLVEGTNDDIIPVTIKYGVPFTVTDEEPEKEGFIFKSWNTKEDGSGTTLTSGDTYDGSEGYILYAIYEETNYTVNYDLAGGTNENIVSVTNPYTKEFNVTSEVPEKVGYKFIEWNTKSDGTGISLAANEIYDRSDGFTLYAIYEETYYTVNYDLQGGTNEKIVSVTNPYTKEFNVTDEVPEKVGFKFIKWNTKADGSGISLAADEVYDRSDGFTLYAIYQKIEEEIVPITGDNINTSIIMLILSSLLFTSCIFIKKYNR